MGRPSSLVSSWSSNLQYKLVPQAVELTQQIINNLANFVLGPSYDIFLPETGFSSLETKVICVS